MIEKLTRRLKWIAVAAAWVLLLGMAIAAYMSESKADSSRQTAVSAGERIAGNGPGCMLRLNGLDVSWIPVPDHYDTRGCGLPNGVLATSWGPVRLRAPVPMTCRMAELTDRWIQRSVRPAARRFLGADVVALHHMAIYDCRRIAGRKDGRLSEHGKSNALDVGAFVLSDGRKISVKDHWRAGGRESQFLRSIGQGACETYQVVLTPDSNRAHHDHFHLDAGRWRVCVKSR